MGTTSALQLTTVTVMGLFIGLLIAISWCQVSAAATNDPMGLSKYDDAFRIFGKKDER